MLLFEDTKTMVRSPEDDTDFFDMFAKVLKNDVSIPFPFINCLDY